MNYICGTCDRAFEYSEDLKKHVLCCEFFYKKHKLRLSADNNTTEPKDDVSVIPVNTAITISSLYELIVKQGREIESLKNEVSKLKTNQTARVNRAVKAELVEETVSISFEDWVKTIEVSMEHLNEVIRNTKVDGIKKCLKDVIEKTEFKNLPIKSCSQKTMSIYVFDFIISKSKKTAETAEPERKLGWVRLNNDHISLIMSCITRGLMLQQFKYQEENEEMLEQNEKQQELLFQCTKKLNNISISNEKQKIELKKWLISYVISI